MLKFHENDAGVFRRYKMETASNGLTQEELQDTKLPCSQLHVQS